MKAKRVRKKRVPKFNHAIEVLESHDEKIEDLSSRLREAERERDAAYRMYFGFGPGDRADLIGTAKMVKRVFELL